jgi:dTDP-glucose pyrophosphorylase
MWGIIPAAGAETRIQPLACSKELLPVGGQHDGVMEHPRAVSEHPVDRMRIGGAEKICFVIGPKKFDIVEYYSAYHAASSTMTFVIQPRPQGLCDALFRCVDLIPPDERRVLEIQVEQKNAQYTSPPRELSEYADFCCRMIQRYAQCPDYSSFAKSNS